MRARSHASAGAILSEVRLSEVGRPDDARLIGLAELLNRTFPDPNSVLGLDRIQEFLAANSVDAPRHFYVLAAEHDGDVCGASIFSYVKASNCGFSEYLVVDRQMRERGFGRALFDRRKAILDTEAVNYAQAACRGLFIEVDNPERTPAEMLEAERQTSIDPYTRLRVFGHLGFRRVDVPYIQPPLADGKELVDYLDLLFAPWEPSDVRRIPSQWLFDTLAAIWSAWTPHHFAAHLADLRAHVPTDEIDLSSPSTSGRGLG